ncbi:regulatory protein UhpC [Escherichia coli]|nr:regulatory protein UhpC [Escherichia coli]
MLPFLKAPADAPLMTDKHEIDARYRYWRRHILLTIWLGYALFYFTRKSFNSAVPEILANGVLSRSDIGLLATLFYITYGVSKFVSGIVSDRSNARYFMGIGLIATGIINILFGFSTSLWAFAVLWVLNAFFQGWGSPVCARLLTAWYSRTERGGWWALWNTAHNVGGALIPIVMAASALHYGWRAGMMIAGCMAIVVGIFLCWRLRDRPQALGLPAVGEWRHDALEIAQQQEGAGLTRKEILTKYVLLNPYIWLLSFCYVLVYVVRAAINDWGNLYMSETLGVDLVTANTAVTMFELGGFIGALVAGWGSDKLFNGNRGPMNLIFAAGILLSVGSLWLMPFASYVMQATCFFTIGFFCLWPADVNRHGGGRVFPQRGGRGGDGVCRLVCLSWCVACWLAAGESTRYLALERIFCGYRHRRRDFRTAVTALFERPDTARSVMHLTFSLHIRQN